MNLRTKLALGLALTLAVLVQGSGLSSWHMMRQDLLATIQNQLQALVTHAAGVVESDLKLGVDSVAAIANGAPPSPQRNRAALDNYLSHLPLPLGAFERCVAIAPDGELLAEAPYQGQIASQNVADNEYFRRATQTRQAVIFKPQRQTVSVHPVVAITLPRLVQGDAVDLVMACTLNLLKPELFVSARTAAIGDSGYLFIVTPDRRVILHPDSKMMAGGPLPPGAYPMLDKVLDGLEVTEEGTAESTEGDGRRVLMSFKRVKSTGWLVAAVFPVDEAYKPLDLARSKVMLRGAIVLILSTIAAWLLAGLATVPLTRLTRQMRQMRDNPEAPSPPRLARHDEIGELNDAFLHLLAERNQREASLRSSAESSRILRMALEHSDEAIIAADVDHRLTLWNRGAEQMLGWTAAEVLGRRSDELGLHDRSAPDLEGLQAQLMAGKAFTREGRRKTKFGEWIDVSSTAIPMFDEQGKFAGALVTIRDVTTLKAAEAALRASEEKFSCAFRANPDATVITRMDDGVIVDVNEGFERLSGYSAAEAIGKTAMDIGLRADAAEREVMERRLMADGALRDWETHVVTKSGAERLMLGSVSTFELGGRRYAISNSRDITELKGAEDEVRRLHDELEERVRERTAELESFSYSVSHDLRSPLRAIAGFARLIEEDHGEAIGPAGRDLLHRVMRNAVRMGGLIDDLLDFSRIGRATLKHTKVDMNAMAREVTAELMESEPERSIDLHIGPLPEAWADRSLIRQVWVNLLGNALKYSRGRQRTVIGIGGEVGDGEVHYFVSDNGAGFDMEFADKLFQVFQRLHNESSFEGTGIGLAITARVVRRHGGRIWAVGVPDRGATFHFALPLAS